MMSPIHLTRAALIARTSIPSAVNTMVAAATWLESHGCTPVIEESSAEAAGVGGRWATTDRTSLANGVDVVLTFGGDGTLLDAARAVAHSSSDAPLVGINLGRLGFLTDVGPTEL